MIYKSGDKVRIVKKIPARSAHGFAEDMAYFLGKIVTIFDRRINTFGEYYIIKEDHGIYMWDQNMFQKIDNILDNE